MTLKHQNFNIDSLFPVNLILKDKRCKIIGGGKVATHKAEKLINVGILPTVVSKKFSKTLLNFSEQGLVTLVKRDFEDEDLNNIFLLFIATDNTKLNSYITDLCNDHNILSCAVDNNWHKSAFITPASFEENGLTVSVSTGGKSCRYARLIKDNIKRYITTTEDNEFLVIGTDFRYLHSGKREQLHASINNPEIPEMLSNIIGIHEFMIVNTCNRVEIYALTKNNDNIEKIILKLLDFNSFEKNEYFIKRDSEAFKHLTLVTSGIYSQLIGENHITSQIKEAFILSENKKWSGGILKGCIETALCISKQIRNSVSTIIKPTEIENLTIKYLLSMTDINISKNSIAILGTGQVGTKLIEELLGHDAQNITWFYNKHIPMSKNSKINLCPLTELNSKIHDFDIIISAIKVNKPYLTEKLRTDKNVSVIDLGMPRNISENFSKNTIDLEKLKYWYRKEICSIETVLPTCEKIISENIINYEKIINSLKSWNKK